MSLKFSFDLYIHLSAIELAMIKVQGREKEIQVEFNGSNIELDGEQINIDLLENKDGSFHIIHDSRGYTMKIISANPSKKEFEIEVNGTIYSLSAKDKYDDLLERLGMDLSTEENAEDLIAPMPGLVLDVKVEVGQSVAKGDLLLVLEAMKMENNIKCPADGVIKSIEVEQGVAVAKGQVLICFE
ncbi:MAG: acetyl-CoA carboxylase biotin carboxyl carrier protein subunit [Crocinitomicaceae bacterium]|nr:acetyl-CoA carboxylase biotin carboxyl carrier protein subunit [Crocinitomicaceae bacterium]|tara:strand:- start:16605 stop:17159 length:555 start_codon:yes stop_codon:yes gene_type:complete